MLSSPAVEWFGQTSWWSVPLLPEIVNCKKNTFRDLTVLGNGTSAFEVEGRMYIS
jgi:hypothetical protein